MFWFWVIAACLHAQNFTRVTSTTGKYGYVDIQGDTIIKAEHFYAEEFSEGMALVKNNLTFKIIDTLGELYDISELKYNDKFKFDIGENNTGLPVIVKIWECVFYNEKAEAVLKIPYHDAESFVNSQAKVILGQKYNFIDKNGVLLDQWKDITDQNYKAVKSNDKYGYINTKGKLVIDYQFVKARDFKDSIAIVGNENKWAVINTEGKIISEWYDYLSDFYQNVAVYSLYKKYGFINKQGKIVSEGYTKIEIINEDLFLVHNLDKVAFTNSNGKLITDWFEQQYGFNKNLCKVKKADKFAYINNLGTIIIGWYDSIADFNDGITKVKNKDKYAIVNQNGNLISDWYQYIDNYSDAMAIVSQNNKYGYLNKEGKLIIPCTFDNAKPFVQGMAIVVTNEKYAYIDKQGKFIVEPHERMIYYSKAPPKGLTLIIAANKYGFQNVSGTTVIPCIYEYAENFSDNLALVKNYRQEKFIDINGELHQEYKDDGTMRHDWGNTHTKQPIKIETWECAYINEKGEVKLKIPYSNAFSFSGGIAKVENVDKYNFIDTTCNLISTWKEYSSDYVAVTNAGKFGYVDKNNKQVIDYKFDYAYDFKNNRAIVRIGDSKTGKYAVINKTGKQISEFYSLIKDFQQGVAIVKNDNKYAIIDTTGKLISTWYDQINEFDDKKAIVKLNDRYAFIDNNGKLICKLYQNVYPYQENRAKILNNNRWGFIDETGKLVVETIYEGAWNYSNGIAKVKKDGKYGFINLEGNLITALYDRLYSFSEGFAVVVNAGKYGFINQSGELIIECKYDNAYTFSDGKAIVTEGTKSFYINKKGIKIKEIE